MTNFRCEVCRKRLDEDDVFFDPITKKELCDDCYDDTVGSYIPDTSFSTLKTETAPRSCCDCGSFLEPEEPGPLYHKCWIATIDGPEDHVYGR